MLDVINYLGDRFSNGGIESFVTNISERINKADILYRICVNYRTDSVFKSRLDSTNTEIVYLSESKKNYIEKMLRLFTFFRKNKNAIIIFHASSPAMYIHCFIARLAGVNNIVYHIHSTSPSYRLSFIIVKNKILRRLFYRIPKVNIACSQEAGENIYLSDFHIIKNGIKIELFAFSDEKRNLIRSRYKLKDKLIIGQVGRFAYPKNQLFSLSLAKKLVDKNFTDFALVLIGDGQDKENIENYIKKNGLENYVIMISNTMEVHNFYCMMDCILFPSFFEGLGIVAIEAQANGLDVLCSEGIPNEVFISENAKRINLDCIDEWISAILESPVSIQERKEKSIRNMEKCNLNGFSSSSSGKELERFLKAIVK